MTLGAVVGLMRPLQWYKNVIVFVPLLFSDNFTNVALWPRSLGVFAAFCLLASASYAWNDVLDAGKDRAHPTKRRRPVASGTIRPALGLVLALAWAAAGLTVLVATNRPTLAAGVAYLLLQVLYTLVLKHWLLWDVIAIGVGFVLRALAGTAVLEVGPPTEWLILCTFLLALFLGFAKRDQELTFLGRSDVAASPADHRWPRSLQQR